MFEKLKKTWKIVMLPSKLKAEEFFYRKVINREFKPGTVDEIITLSCGHQFLLRRHLADSFPCVTCKEGIEGVVIDDTERIKN